MKPYLQGLITGILLTVSAMMFMGANAMQDYDDYYDRKIYRIVQNIESQISGGVYAYNCD
jgi:hypothetical protein